MRFSRSVPRTGPIHKLMSDSVLISELETANGCRLGHAALNVESTLNALSLDMVRSLTPALTRWSQDDSVTAVLITGAGDRAFCAGGDIQALYRAIVANHDAGSVVDDYPFRFFEEEYRLDYQIHTFSKPVITLGHGVVMGGGLGIFGASSHRIVTEKSRLAVPEITIGLFPDAGGTWTLGNMPAHWASFLGLTGSQINGADALLCGLATHAVGHDGRDSVLATLLELPWQNDADADEALVSEALDALVPPSMPESALVKIPEREIHRDDLAAEVAATHALAGASDWVDRGLKNLAHGCPTTAGIVIEQLRRVVGMSLADTFRPEVTVATHCAHNEDFREGVRALLIDKDNSPQWRFGDLEHLQWDHVLSHFDEPWPEHPLADLGSSV